MAKENATAQEDKTPNSNIENQDNNNPPQDPPQNPPESSGGSEPPDQSEGGETPEVVEKELWQLGDDEIEGEEKPGSVPLGAHVAKKKELQGRLTEKESEIDELRQRLRAYEGEDYKKDSEDLQRPNEDDFETYEEYHIALEAYEDKRAEARYKRIEAEGVQRAEQERRKVAINSAVDAHFDRAAKLIESTPGMKPEVYKQADMSFRKAIDEISPGNGDMVADVLVEAMGEGSEKVGYHIGLSKAARAEFQSLLADKNGGLLKACVFLGRKLEQAGTKVKQNQQSRTPAPAATHSGDESGTSEAKFKRQYDEAKKKGDLQKLFEIKGKAKAAGVNVSKWNR